MRKLSARGLLVLLGVAAVAAVLAQAGSASAPSSGNKLFDACLQLYQGAPACSTENSTGGQPTELSGGSEPKLSLTVSNDLASSTSMSIGSMQLQAPSGFTIGNVESTPAGNVAAQTSSSFEILNLGLAPGQSVTVTFETSTPIPCSGGDLKWIVKAKQSNNFSGSPGNDYGLNLSTGLTSEIVTGCKLAFTVQPASAVKNQTITNTAYDPTVNDPGVTPAVANVQVSAEDGNGNVLTDLNSGTVSLSSTPSGSFSGATSVPFVSGVATFSTLSGSTVGSGYTLTATSGGFQPATSNDFNISLSGENCRKTGNCSLLTTQVNKDTQVTSSGSGGVFEFLAIDQSSIPDDVTAARGGCANILAAGGVGGAIVNEADGRTTGSGTLTFVYALSKSVIQKVPNNGNPFVPICAGAAQLDTNGNVVACTPGTPGGWTGDVLDSSGAFTGATKLSVCGADNLWWNVLGTYQDKIDATLNPTITSWQGGSQYRSFTISVPWPWDVRFGSP